MTIADLKEILARYPSDSKIAIYDPNTTEFHTPIVGFETLYVDTSGEVYTEGDTSEEQYVVVFR